MATVKRDGRTEFDGTVYTQRLLMTAACAALEEAESNPRGSKNRRMYAAVFAWLAFEAYLNAVIEHIDPAVFAAEHRFFTAPKKYRGVLGKDRWIRDKLSIAVPRRTEQSRRKVLQLHRLRNALVHARPVHYRGVISHPLTEEAPRMADAWVEPQISQARVRRFIGAVVAYCEWLNSNVRPQFADPHMRVGPFVGTPQLQTWRTSTRLRRPTSSADANLASNIKA